MSKPTEYDSSLAVVEELRPGLYNVRRAEGNDQAHEVWECVKVGETRYSNTHSPLGMPCYEQVETGSGGSDPKRRRSLRRWFKK